MTKDQALKIAKINHAEFTKADIEVLFGRAPKFDAFAKFGFRRGWYHVGNYGFNIQDLTGDAYDANQGGWAFA